jgi:hypothetical protein
MGVSTIKGYICHFYFWEDMSVWTWIYNYISLSPEFQSITYKPIKFQYEKMPFPLLNYGAKNPIVKDTPFT